MKSEKAIHHFTLASCYSADNEPIEELSPAGSRKLCYDSDSRWKKYLFVPYSAGYGRRNLKQLVKQIYAEIIDFSDRNRIEIRSMLA